MATHVVEAGETLFGLAQWYGTSVADLQGRNGLTDPSLIFVGQVLDVPGADPPPPPPPSGTPVTYVVQAGDTLFSLARRFGTTVADLQGRNGIANADALFVGQVLNIGDAPAAPPPPPDPQLPPATVTLPVALFGSRASDPATQALVPIFDRWADAYGIARDLLKGLAFVESSWRPDARSPSGAVGLCQLLPSTASWVAQTMLGGVALDPAVPEHNVQLGSRYLRYLFDLLVEPTASVAAYYQGPVSVQRNGVTAAGATYAQRVAAARANFT